LDKEQDLESSILREVCECRFGDVRLTDRLSSITDRLNQHPTLSLPAAMGSRSELELGYRFFDHAEATPERILRGHRHRTLERIMGVKVCLMVQDTTELELTRPNQQVVGAGPLSADSRWGAYLHPLIAYTPERLNLGTVWQKSWARDSIDTESTAKEKSKRLAKMAIEEKESYRWLEGQREARQVAEMCADTQCIMVGDSEADIYEVFSETRKTSHHRPLELLIRGCQNRATDVKGVAILDIVKASETVHSMVIDVSGRKAKTKVETGRRSKSRLARKAVVEVRACQVTLRPPPRPGQEKLPHVTIQVVLVEEQSPPPGDEAISWMLVTTLPIDTPDQVLTIVDYYCCRWLIESYFKILKSGCRIEERLFETLPRMMNVIAVYMIVAWRIQMLCHLGRECPDIDCSIVFEESEWKAVYIVATKKQPPETPPTLNTIIRLIASLGGYIVRKDTHPGIQTLWIGMQRMRDLACGYEAFGPKSKMLATTCVGQ